MSFQSKGASNLESRNWSAKSDRVGLGLNWGKCTLCIRSVYRVGLSVFILGVLNPPCNFQFICGVLYQIFHCDLPPISLPDPPTTSHSTPQQLGGLSPSMEHVNGQLPTGTGMQQQQLPGIPEVATPYSSVLSDFSLSDLNTRLQAMKTEINAVPTIPEPTHSN